MKETFRNFPKGKPDQEDVERHNEPEGAKVIRESKVDSDPIARYAKIYHKIMMGFGYRMLDSKEKNLAVPNNMERIIKNYDTDRLVAEIENSKEEQWKGREVLFKAITDEIYLRLWPTRRGLKRKSKSADIVPFK